MYLDGFARAGRKGRRQLEVLDLATGSWRRESPKNAARQRDYYRVEVPGVDPLFYESELLGRIEDATAPVLANVRGGHLRLSPEELGTLVGFIALMHVRVDLSQQQVHDGVASHAKQVLARKISTPEAFELTRQAALADGLDIQSLTLESIQGIIDGTGYKLRLNQSVYMALMATAWEELTHIYVQRPWQLLVAPPQSGLLTTSDTPVSYYVHGNSQQLDPYVVRPEDQEAVIQMPLSPHVLLVSDFNIPQHKHHLSISEVAQCNTMSALPGRRCVYALTSHFRWMDPAQGELQDPTALVAIYERERVKLERLRTIERQRLTEAILADDPELAGP